MNKACTARPLTAAEQNIIDKSRALSSLRGGKEVADWLRETFPGEDPMSHELAYAAGFGVATALIAGLLEMIDRPSAQLDGQEALFHA